MKTRLKQSDVFELDEIYLCVDIKDKDGVYKTAYVMTMCSENPRQIAGFDVAFDREPSRIEKLVWSAPPAKEYRTDGYQGYIFVSYPGHHKRNSTNKNDTYTAESINSDLRHYIALLHRKSKCFPRKIKNLILVLNHFVSAYNAFGRYKEQNREIAEHKPTTRTRHTHKYKYPNDNLLNFI